MLPPVLASPASYTSATDMKPRPEQPVGSRATAPASPPMPTAINQTSAIAGQLNIMLLSGPERMSQNLSVLADVLGAALKIERRADETPGDYMGRLIEGIAALPAADRLKLQKLLIQSFAGLQLRTLLAAMAAPSGPERATLALYLELYRQTDRDGATRSVISSYREAAGEARSTAPSVNRPLAANDAGRATGDPQHPAQTAAEQNRPVNTPAAEAKGNAEARAANDGPPQRPDMDATRSARATTATPSGSLPGLDIASGRPESLPVATGASQPLQKAGTEPQTSRAAPFAGLSPSPTDSPATQVLSGQRLPAPASGAAGQPEEQAPGGGIGAPDRQTPPSATSPTAMPVIAVPGQARPTPSVPVGWLAELLESEFVRALLQLKSLSTESKATARPSIAPGLEAQLAATPAAPPVSSDETSDSTEQLARMQDAALTETTEERPAPGAIPLSEQALARFPIAREGMPIPFIPYQVEDEFDVERVDEKEEEDSGNRDGQKDAEDDDRDEAVDGDEHAADVVMPEGEGPAGEPAETYMQESMVAELSALPAPSETALPLPPEPAHELYLRMAGLT
ncbi:hypothetical protein SAMN05880561_10196 [Rhizobium sp. RU33A]|uniref:hypothetical protein n=1 Tax=Rhizobium sp. RU33A TaxID=1907413 RepID=UPI0009550BDE|nr:hypothetical protein [Rhizobium sp. RU33A]SIP89745.1 hypothetical protein SAMN05880561_10196 [Rhizobium sp. RU33A]